MVDHNVEYVMLKGDPYEARMGATKQYVDNAIAGAVIGGSAGIAANLTAMATLDLLPADRNIVVSCPSGTGFTFDASRYEQTVTNLDPVNVLNVYPPSGTAFNAQAVDAPYLVAPGGGKAMFDSGTGTHYANHIARSDYVPD